VKIHLGDAEQVLQHLIRISEQDPLVLLLEFLVQMEKFAQPVCIDLANVLQIDEDQALPDGGDHLDQSIGLFLVDDVAYAIHHGTVEAVTRPDLQPEVRRELWVGVDTGC
jgi:hypothetical protein